MQGYPKGKLLIEKNGKYNKWYQRIGGKLIYIPKKNILLAKRLAEKKYILARIEDAFQEIESINKLLKSLDSYKSKQKSLLDSSEITNLLTDFFSLDDAWKNEEFERNSAYKENLIYKSISGNILRSKSEVLIDMSLYQRKIPYRYECALYIDERVVFPDFTIRNPVTEELFYWEHFGMLDNPSYVRSCMKKLETYIENGIFPNKQLIITYESKDNPISVEDINEIIDKYFSW